ncbi:alanine--tRNA ligase, partial [Escherichia coli]
YVLRRIIRRAVRHGYMLGAKDTFFYKLVAPLIDVMGSAGEELARQRVMVEKVLKSEEEQFARTLERGLQLLDDELASLTGDTLSGEAAFRLYDTYGFPLDLTADVCRERNLKVDEAGFEAAMEEQRRRARENSGFGADYNSLIKVDKRSDFSGYDHNEQAATIVALYKEGQPVTELNAGDEGLVILDKTAFYAESGGQVGDTGVLSSNDAQFSVLDTQKYGQAIGHAGRVDSGKLTVNHKITAKIDEERRNAIRLNHSATHLMHAALRQVLGEHVSQKGSLVNDKYLRFDFSHFEAMTPAQIREVEALVNAEIRKNEPVVTELMDLEEAKAKGAMALFGEKYDERVRVLSMGDFSTELCGGTHAARTGDIGLFRIISESATAAGIRRIEAVTGAGALESVNQQSDALSAVAQLVKSDEAGVSEKVKAALDKIRTLEKELQQLKEQQAAQESSSMTKDAVSVNGVKLLVKQLTNAEPKMLRTMVDDLKNQLSSGIIVLSTISDDKVSLIAGVTKDLTGKVKAGELVAFIAEQIGGKGGGRPDMAQAGGTDTAALPAAMASVESWVASHL